MVKVNPDKQQAERHLKLLGPIATEFTFQTFADNKSNPSNLTRILNGTLDEHWDELCKLSEQGAGIFITVNETDGTGRKEENIIRVRAVYQDADNPNATIPSLEPHIVIESSPGKFHRY